MPKPENRYPNNGSGFEHIWELDVLNKRAILRLKIITDPKAILGWKINQCQSCR